MILSCILLRKMDNVFVSGFGSAIGLGKFGEIWALAKDARTETDIMPTGTTARAIGRTMNAWTMRQGPTLVDREAYGLVSISIKLRIAQKRFFGRRCIRRPPAW